MCIISQSFGDKRVIQTPGFDAYKHPILRFKSSQTRLSVAVNFTFSHSKTLILPKKLVKKKQEKGRSIRNLKH